MRIMYRWTILATVLLASCHHEPLRYQLTREQGSAVLIPPNVSRSRQVKIPGARQQAARESCDIANPMVALSWRGTTAQLRVASASPIVVGDESRPYASP